MINSNTNKLDDQIKQKLKFRISEVTSQEEGYPVSELLNHTPYSKGWQSSRFCDYPQEITIEFPAYVKIKQLQFLSHQYKISSKIEILIFNPKTSKKYKKIGFLTLDSNEQANFEARELKSVYVDYECLKIKVILHRCYINNLNNFVQVGLIALNVMGFPTVDNPFDKPPNFNNKHNTDKLEDELIYDPITYKRLKALEKAKSRAIEYEDYEEAQKIKEAIDRLKSVSNQLVQLEERKNIAIKNDNFMAAKAIKYEIERLRNAVAGINLELTNENPNYNKMVPPYDNNKFQNEYNSNNNHYNMYNYDQNGPMNNIQTQNNPYNKQKLNINENNHIEKYQINSENLLYNNKISDKSNNINFGTKLVNKNEQNYAFENNNNNYNNVHNNYNNHFNSINDNDDRPIKGVDRSFGGIISQEIKKGSSNKNNNNNFNYEEEDISDDIPSNLYKYAEPIIPYISHDLAKLLFSNNWRNKEKGLKILSEEIKLHPQSKLLSSHNGDKILTSVTGVIAHTLTENISQVLLESMEVIKILFNKFHSSNVKGYYRGDLDTYIDNILILLLEKSGDSNIKVKERSQNSILEMANNPIVGSKLVFEHIISGQIKKTLINSVRHLTGRLNLLHRLLINFGLNTEEVPVDSLMSFAFNSFSHQNKEVRDISFKVIMEAYRFIGDNVKNYYKGLRKPQIDLLEEGFDNVDSIHVNKKYQDDNFIETNKFNEKKAILNNAKTNNNNNMSYGNIENIENNNYETEDKFYNTKKEYNKFSSVDAYQEDPRLVNLNNEDKNDFNSCIYCNHYDPNFNEDDMIVHYARDCPMMFNCDFCKKVFEISQYNYHLKNECINKELFRECTRCKEPVLKRDFDFHVSEKFCMPAKNPEVVNRCPLCHLDIAPSGKEGWEKHLLSDGCPSNPRTNI